MEFKTNVSRKGAKEQSCKVLLSALALWRLCVKFFKQKRYYLAENNL
jgi:hypothetical protein